MKSEDFTSITADCCHGEPPTCSVGCPFGLDIRTFMERVRKSNWTLAYKLLRNSVLFPDVVCRVCTAPCEAVCQRSSIGDEPLNLRGIEAACIRFAKNKSPESYRIPQKNARIAVVGAGPAGLSCALNLAQKRYGVAVFDRADAPGGSLAAHPQAELFREDFALQFSKVDVSFSYGADVKSLDELPGYDAIYVATGAHGEDFGLLRAAGGAGGGATKNPKTENPKTKNPGVFLGGGLCGRNAVQSIADGFAASRMIETAIQTGSGCSGTFETFGSAEARREPRVFDHSSVPSAPRVIPSDGVSYTVDEAVREAERCMKCDCRKCMDVCEVLAAWSKAPQKISREAFLDLQTNPPFSNRTLTRETYSCNICGYCRSVCPAGIDMGDVFRLSRTARRESGKYPDAFHEFWLRDMDFVTRHASCAIPPDDGFKTEQGSYVFFPGCKLGGYTPSRVISSARFLRERYGAGIVLDCCGAPAYWAGEDARHRAHIDVLRGVWQSMGKPVFVFACAYCEMIFGRFLPEIERVSLYALLADCMAESADVGGVSLEKSGNAGVQKSGGAGLQKSGAALSAKYSVFDPCASPPDGAVAESVRRLALGCGAELHELPEQGRCCGFGGHMRAANPPLYDTMTKNRAEMGESPYIVYCANCEDVFRRSGKDCIHVIDLLFGTPPESGGGIPDLQTQRDRMAGLKSDLENSYKGAIGGAGGTSGAGDAVKTAYSEAVPVPYPEPWDGVNVVIDDGMLRRMDEDLIMKSDVKEAVWTAESRKDFFYNATDGIRQCCLVKPSITYWVQYRPAEKDTYEVLQVYSHRMRFDADM